MLLNASAFGLREYVDTLSPLVAMLLLDRSYVIVGKFFEILRSPTVTFEPRFYALMLCTSRTQVSCGRYKSYCLPACHTLVRRYCWIEAARTDIMRTLTRDWFYRRALHTGGWRVSVYPTLVESSVATPGPC